MKKIIQHVFVTFLTVCLLFIGGCAGENAQNHSEMEVSEFSILEDSGDSEKYAEAEDTSTTENEVESEQTPTTEAEGTNTSVSSQLQVQFLDVGQGSAALLHQGDSWMLIDGGDRDYSSYVVSYLKKQGITSLDYVVATHYDSDHLSGLVGVLNAFECKQVLAADYEMDTKVYRSFWEVIESKGIPVTYPKQKEVYKFADSSLEIVAPAYYGYEDSNSNSIGIRIKHGENSFLICGDCTEESEQDLLYQRMDVDSDVFAANHHGSKHSNTEEFLEAVSPDYVVISCGAGNDYGHPHASVMLGIQKKGAQLYRTDLQGTITAVSDGKDITFKNEVCMDYRSGSEIEGNQQKPEENQQGNQQQVELGDAQENDLPATGLEQEAKYVLNTNSMKFHFPDCSSAKDMDDKNKEYSKDSRATLIKQGYVPCKRCNP